MNFLVAREKTMHVFHACGRSFPVALREREGNVAVFETLDEIPLTVALAEELPVGQTAIVERGSFRQSAQILRCRPRQGAAPLSFDMPVPIEISVVFSRSEG